MPEPQHVTAARRWLAIWPGEGSAGEIARTLQAFLDERSKYRWLLRDVEPFVQHSNLQGKDTLAARVRAAINGEDHG
jgi:hypothetical protein